MIAVAAAAQGVALLHERIGHVSLAGIGLMAVGGWIGLRVSHGTGLPFEVSLLAAAGGTAGIAMLLGLPAIRHKGLIFALVTLMFAAGLHVVVSSVGFPDGGSGFWGRVSGSEARALMARPALAETDRAYFIYCVIIVALAFVATFALLKSSAGRAWAMIRAGDSVAKSAGVRLQRARFQAFAVAGALAGIGGCLMAGSIGQLDGRSFDPLQSLLLYGLVIGDIAMIIFGAALVHAIVSAPRGIAGQMQDLGGLIRSKLKGGAS